MQHVQHRFFQEAGLADFAFLQGFGEVQSDHAVLISYLHIFVFNGHPVKDQINDRYDQLVAHRIHHKGGKVVIENVKAFHFNMGIGFVLVHIKVQYGKLEFQRSVQL